jgi:hypothetical protein
MSKQMHVYTKQMQGYEYVLDDAEEMGTGEKLYMTSWRLGVHCGDYIVFQDGDAAIRYQVEKISFYHKRFFLGFNYSSLWIALLVRCN